jgi:hypothetical protein
MNKTQTNKKTVNKKELQDKLKMFAHLIVDRLLEEENKGVLRSRD